MAIQLLSNGKVKSLLKTIAEIISVLNPFSGATENDNGSSGLVPAPLSADRTKFLRGDGTWQTVSGGGGSGGISQQDVEDMLQDYLPLTGGNLTNDLTINNVSVITSSELSSELANYLPLTGGNITNSLTIQTKDISVIEASGTNYIRYTNGIQICWNSVEVTNSDPTHTFPMAFNAVPSLTLTLNESITRATSVQAKTLTATNFSASIYSNSHSSGTVKYIAIGTWK